MKILSPLPLGLSLGLWSACSPPTAPAPAVGNSTSASSAEDDHANPNEIEIPSLVRRNLGITFAPVERRRVAHTLRIPGSFEYQPLARREFRLALAGHVDLLVDHLQAVEPGQVLFRFQSPQWPEYQHEILEGEQAEALAAAQVAVAQAKLDEAQAQRDLLRDRLQTLQQAEVRRADLEAEAAQLATSLPRLRAEREAAQASLGNAQRTKEHALHRAASASGLTISELLAPVELDGQTAPRFEHMDWIEVHAETAGVVEALHVSDGAYVQSPETILTTVDPTQVRFRGLALQADLNGIVQSQAAHLLPPKGRGYAGTQPVPARIVLGLDAHPEERTQVLYALPQDSQPWMRPGLATFLEIELQATQAPTLAIPRASIVRDGLQHVFFRRDPSDPDHAWRVEADMGLSDGEWVEIFSGLALGDEVVVDGAFELKLASERGGGMPKGGHFHADGSFHAEEE